MFIKYLMIVVCWCIAHADSCIYGDYRGYFTLGTNLEMNCTMIGIKQPWRCYDVAYSMDCCETCARVRNNAAPGMSFQFHSSTHILARYQAYLIN
jgi:hypothetical protein